MSIVPRPAQILLSVLTAVAILTPAAPAQPLFPSTSPQPPATAPAPLPPAQLTADNLLLIVNGNSPQSIASAEFYAKARLVPDGRICKLDLPFAEEIPFDVYERNVVPQIRAFIRDNKLETRVKCLVLFYGTPIRIAAPQWGTAATLELRTIQTELAAAENRLLSEVSAYEAFVARAVPGFTAPPAPPGAAASDTSVEVLLARFDRAGRALGAAIEAAPPEKKAELVNGAKSTIGLILGDNALLERFGKPELAHPNVPPETVAAWKAVEARVEAAKSALAATADRRFDPADRARARTAIKDSFGLLRYVKFLREQQGYFGSELAMASLDSELQLLWIDFYDRSRFLGNPLYLGADPYHGPPLLMTARLDGPDESAARFLVLASLKAERDGLTGKVVIDSRGMRSTPNQPNAYATYDDTLRRLAELIRGRTRMPLLLDEQDAVLPPNSVKDVALYAGWYSVGNYVPACTFRPGAVGFHIASYEMVTLRDPNTKAWVPNLIKDNIAATLGPVAEPYLLAFPDADEFFPLLLTGKLTLAECYWKTQKTASWQMSLIGDPLYRPFAKDPQLKPEDLPPRLLKALK